MSWAAAAGAAGSIIGGIAGPLITNGANKKAATQQHNRNKEYWNLQNAYNHPTQQMARLREAGLNPNLIYGTPSSASVGNADKISPASMAKVQPINIKAGEAFDQYTNIKNTEAQTDNLLAQNNVILSDKKLKDSQTLNQLTQAGNTGLKTKREKELHSSQLQALEQDVRQKTATADVTEGSKEAAIGTAIQKFKHAKSDAEIRELALNLKRMGIEPSDNMIYRMMAQFGSQPDSMRKIKILVKELLNVPAYNPFKN